MKPDYRLEAEITRAAFDRSPDAIIVVGPGGAILAANEQAELLAGIPKDALVGQSVDMLVPNRFREGHRLHREGYLSRPRHRAMGPGLELTLLQRTGTGEVEIPVDVNLSPAVLSIGTIVVATIRLRGAGEND